MMMSQNKNMRFLRLKYCFSVLENGRFCPKVVLDLSKESPFLLSMNLSSSGVRWVSAAKSYDCSRRFKYCDKAMLPVTRAMEIPNATGFSLNSPANNSSKVPKDEPSKVKEVVPGKEPRAVPNRKAFQFMRKNPVM